MEEKVALKVDHLSVNYDTRSVLSDVSFSIPRGSLVGILGPNGAGKSTLLKALLGLVKPLSGDISFFGSSYKKMRRFIAYVPQRTMVDWDFPVSVLDVVLMGAYIRRGLFKRIKPEDRALAKKALLEVGLDALADRQISELSGGQQQKVFIARALIQQTEMYLMDEPFAGVDMTTEKVLIDILKGLQKDKKTIFVVHHDLSSVRKYFDYVILLHKELVAAGPIEEVFTKENLGKTYSGISPLLDIG